METKEFNRIVTDYNAVGVIEDNEVDITVIDSTCMGVVSINIDKKDEYPIPLIHSLMVNEEYRRMNFASNLIDKCESLLLELGESIVAIEAKTNSWQHAWYKRLGYIESSSGDGYVRLVKKLTVK